MTASQPDPPSRPLMPTYPDLPGNVSGGGATWTAGIAGDSYAAEAGPVLGQVWSTYDGVWAHAREVGLGWFKNRTEARAAVEAALKGGKP